VNLNVVLPFCSSLLSFIFFVFLIDQWRERRRPYQLVWAIGMLWYGLSAGTEFLGGAVGWSDPLYRAWYLIGAVWVAGWLGLGTVMLLGRTRFGYAFALSVLLAGLFTYLSYAKYQYADSGIAPFVYFAVGLLMAALTVVLTWRGDDRWPTLAAALVVVGTVASAVMIATAHLYPGSFVNPTTHIPEGTLLPGYLRLMTPFFNITGAFALALGALFSAYVFMPKRRVIPYTLRRGQPVPDLLRNLALGVVAFPVNLLASLPGAAIALVTGKLNTRVPATILIAIGGTIPAITSGMNRFGETGGFFVGELLGVVFLFAGFLVSVEVFREFRVPFTHRVLRVRDVTA
jgi:hypothetical protein